MIVNRPNSSKNKRNNQVSPANLQIKYTKPTRQVDITKNRSVTPSGGTAGAVYRIPKPKMNTCKTSESQFAFNDSTLNISEESTKDKHYGDGVKKSLNRKYKEATMPGKTGGINAKPYLNYLGHPKDKLNNSGSSHYSNSGLLGTISNFDQIKTTLIKQAKDVNGTKPTLIRSESRKARQEGTIKVRLFNHQQSLNPRILDSKHMRNLKVKVPHDSLSTATSSLFPSIRNADSLNNRLGDSSHANYNLEHLHKANFGTTSGTDSSADYDSSIENGYASSYANDDHNPNNHSVLSQNPYIHTSPHMPIQTNHIHNAPLMHPVYNINNNNNIIKDPSFIKDGKLQYVQVSKKRNYNALKNKGKIETPKEEDMYKDETIRQIILENRQMKEKITALLEVIDSDELKRVEATCQLNDIANNPHKVRSRTNSPKLTRLDVANTNENYGIYRNAQDAAKINKNKTSDRPHGYGINKNLKNTSITLVTNENNSNTENSYDLTPRIAPRTQAVDYSEVDQTATFGKGEEFTSFNAIKNSHTELSPNSKTKNTPTDHYRKEKDNEVYVSFLNDNVCTPDFSGDKKQKQEVINQSTPKKVPVVEGNVQRRIGWQEDDDVVLNESTEVKSTDSDIKNEYLQTIQNEFDMFKNDDYNHYNYNTPNHNSNNYKHNQQDYDAINHNPDELENETIRIEFNDNQSNAPKSQLSNYRTNDEHQSLFDINVNSPSRLYQPTSEEPTSTIREFQSDMRMRDSTMVSAGGNEDGDIFDDGFQDIQLHLGNSSQNSVTKVDELENSMTKVDYEDQLQEEGTLEDLKLNNYSGNTAPKVAHSSQPMNFQRFSHNDYMSMEEMEAHEEDDDEYSEEDDSRYSEDGMQSHEERERARPAQDFSQYRLHLTTEDDDSIELNEMPKPKVDEESNKDDKIMSSQKEGDYSLKINQKKVKMNSFDSDAHVNFDSRVLDNLIPHIGKNSADINNSSQLSNKFENPKFQTKNDHKNEFNCNESVELNANSNKDSNPIVKISDQNRFPEVIPEMPKEEKRKSIRSSRYRSKEGSSRYTSKEMSVNNSDKVNLRYDD